MRNASALIGDAWRLAAPYFRSGDRWTARLMLAAIIGLTLLNVGVDVLLNSWRGAFYDTLQAKDLGAFTHLLLTWQDTETGFMPGFVAIVSVSVPADVLRVYLTLLLENRWRRWMTADLSHAWLSGRAYYIISLSPAGEAAGTDNPDQRIAEDVRDYTKNALSLSLSFMSNIVSLVSFATILWTLSGSVTIMGLAIPGYMLWLALVYAGVGSWLTHQVGRKLVPLQVHQQRVEADFRYGLVRLRDNTEGVALSGGEAVEERGIAHRFAELRLNWVALARRKLKLGLFTGVFSQTAAVFPIVIAAPRYFAGTIQLGDLMRTAGAFSSVNDALSWFVTAYTQLSEWRSQVVRLTTFRQAIAAAQALEGPLQTKGTRAALRDVTVRLPDGTPLLDHMTLSLVPGQATLMTGRSGSGKSTVFRVLAGIWPFGTGQVEHPGGRVLFLPQKSYLPPGTLRDAVCYPDPARDHDPAIPAALSAAGLGYLVPALDDDAPWPQRLSGGELQRLAVARALLFRPDWLFLDEATSSLDPAAEAGLYGLLRTQLPQTTLVSIAHRQAVAAYHERQIVFDREPGQPGQFSAGPAAGQTTQPLHTA